MLADTLEQLLKIGFAEALAIDPENKIGDWQQAPLREFLVDLRGKMGPP